MVDALYGFPCKIAFIRWDLDLNMWPFDLYSLSLLCEITMLTKSEVHR